MSPSSKDGLRNFTGYYIEKRGEIEVKGKGRMQTYWLKGREGFYKPLPNPADYEETPTSPTTPTPAVTEKPKPSMLVAEMPTNSTINADHKPCFKSVNHIGPIEEEIEVLIKNKRFHGRHERSGACNETSQIKEGLRAMLQQRSSKKQLDQWPSTTNEYQSALYDHSSADERSKMPVHESKVDNIDAEKMLLTVIDCGLGKESQESHKDECENEINGGVETKKRMSSSEIERKTTRRSIGETVCDIETIDEDLDNRRIQAEIREVNGNPYPQPRVSFADNSCTSTDGNGNGRYRRKSSPVRPSALKRHSQESISPSTKPKPLTYLFQRPEAIPSKCSLTTPQSSSQSLSSLAQYSDYAASTAQAKPEFSTSSNSNSSISPSQSSPPRPSPKPSQKLPPKPESYMSNNSPSCILTKQDVINGNRPLAIMSNNLVHSCTNGCSSPQECNFQSLESDKNQKQQWALTNQRKQANTEHRNSSPINNTTISMLPTSKPDMGLLKEQINTRITRIFESTPM